MEALKKGAGLPFKRGEIQGEPIQDSIQEMKF
jgi:hypothetical protein